MVIKIFGKEIFSSVVRQAHHDTMGKSEEQSALVLQSEKQSEIGEPSGPDGPEAYDLGYNNYRPVYPVIYDGEITQGEAGPIIRYLTDHYALRLRSEQLFRESEFAQTVIRKFAMWTVGAGLSLDCEPKDKVLQRFGITIDTEAFNDEVEGFWNLYANSTMPDLAGQKTLGQLQYQAFEESLKGGDTLVILRAVGNCVKIQFVDGYHVATPLNCSSNGVDMLWTNGNRVRQGVEIDNNGRHVAYHVRNGLYEWERVPAYGEKTGMKMAYLVYGLHPDIGATRGYPLMAGGIESAKIEADYRKYSLQGAKSRSSIAFTVEHQLGSDGEDPLAGRKAMKVVPPQAASVKDQLGIDINGVAVAKQVTALTGNTTINMPINSQLKMHDSKMEQNVPEFCLFHFKVMSAMVGMPICVAMSEYNDSFSASRMAGKDWEQTFMTWRERFATELMAPIYELQMFLWINSNAVNAPGYIQMLMNGNQIGRLAYLSCRWKGDRFPDIDPLKTVKYIREAMGTAAAHLPVMSPKAAAEELNQGEYAGIMKELSKELENAISLNIPSEAEMKEQESGVETEKEENEE